MSAYNEPQHLPKEMTWRQDEDDIEPPEYILKQKKIAEVRASNDLLIDGVNFAPKEMEDLFIALRKFADASYFDPEFKVYGNLVRLAFDAYATVLAEQEIDFVELTE